MKSMFSAVVDAQQRAERTRREYERVTAEAEARLDAPVTRRDLIEAMDQVCNDVGSSGFPENEAIYNAFDRLRDAISR